VDTYFFSFRIPLTSFPANKKDLLQKSLENLIIRGKAPRG
jgi:hypothetical protein